MHELPIRLSLLGDVFERPKHQSVTARCVNANVLKF
jgi:hypothetical protein